jgi:hypothetical protein
LIAAFGVGGIAHQAMGIDPAPTPKIDVLAARIGAAHESYEDQTYIPMRRLTAVRASVFRGREFWKCFYCLESIVNDFKHIGRPSTPPACASPRRSRSRSTISIAPAWSSTYGKARAARHAVSLPEGDRAHLTSAPRCFRSREEAHHRRPVSA